MTEESTTVSRAPSEAPPFRAGYAALLGRPNVGKSTLLNAWLGEHLSIVSPKPQTTRERVFGICTRPEGQVVFVDTPGLLAPRHRLHEAMQREAEEGLAEADVVVFVCEAGRPETYPDPETADRIRGREVPVFWVANKVDRLGEAARAAVREALGSLGGGVWLVSALTGENLEPLLRAILAALPPSPPLFPPEDLAAQPLRFFAEEYVRETCFEQFGEEVPHSIACRVEEFREDRDPVYIRMTLYVERPSQKRIVVGRGGEAIRRVGTIARRKIEALVGRPVYLDLWVKVLPGWRRKAAYLRRLGYRVPDARG